MSKEAPGSRGAGRVLRVLGGGGGRRRCQHGAPASLPLDGLEAAGGPLHRLADLDGQGGLEERVGSPVVAADPAGEKTCRSFGYGGRTASL